MDFATGCNGCCFFSDTVLGVVIAKAQYQLKNAKRYFEEHLNVGDYYAEGQRISGEWIGNGAQKLELTGGVRAEDVLALCDNLHPQRGKRLTARVISVRT